MKTYVSVLSLILLAMVSFSCKKKPLSGDKLIPFADNIDFPVTITHAGDSRLFVVGQEGYIWIIDTAGNKVSDAFLDIHERVVYGGERGLLGLAFHPNFKQNGFFYINYVGAGDSTHISRFTLSPSDRNLADPASEYKLITMKQPYENHNGGNLCFGPDGYLYIGMGDGGSGGDPENRSQNPSLLLGKMLRIDVNGGQPYAIPTTNPFVDSAGFRPEIWATGLRNPWRFSFDKLTGDLWIADVGQDAIEEIDFQKADSKGGENYGWRCYEGNNTYNTDSCDQTKNFVFPVHTYPHGPECSVTGGYVFRGDVSSPYYGHYFFADYCSDKIWTLHPEGQKWVAAEFGMFKGNNFCTFGEDYQGRIYVAGIKSGTIYKINTSPAPVSKQN